VLSIRFFGGLKKNLVIFKAPLTTVGALIIVLGLLEPFQRFFVLFFALAKNKTITKNALL
jgi:hypothetical protein